MLCQCALLLGQTLRSTVTISPLHDVCMMVEYMAAPCLLAATDVLTDGCCKRRCGRAKPAQQQTHSQS